MLRRATAMMVFVGLCAPEVSEDGAPLRADPRGRVLHDKRPGGW